MRRLSILLLLLSIAEVASAAKISSEFSRQTLLFKLTVSNSASVVRHVTQIGIISNARGRFECLNNATTLFVLADYPIMFPVDRNETLTKADPPVSLPPLSSARFTVSAYPNAAGACGPWSADVHVVVVFDDGTRLENRSETITEADLETLRIRKPDRDDVLQSLSHKHVGLRLQALKQLGQVDIDRLTLETKIRLAFADPDRAVRQEAYRQAAALNLNTLAPDLIARFGKIPLSPQEAPARQADSEELLNLCQTFKIIRAVGAEEGLISTLTNPNFVYAEQLGEVLQKIRTPAMPAKLGGALTAHRGWASDAASPSLAARYAILLKAFIAYRDIDSVPFLESLMTQGGNERTKYVILTNMLAQTDATHRIEDPFVLRMRAASREFINDPWGDERQNLREPAMLLTVRGFDKATEQLAVLKQGLRDKSAYVQLAAAREAATLGLTAMVPAIQDIYRAADAGLKPYFCNALTTLHATCRS
jgi:hypothetical protein